MKNRTFSKESVSVSLLVGSRDLQCWNILEPGLVSTAGTGTDALVVWCSAESAKCNCNDNCYTHMLLHILYLCSVLRVVWLFVWLIHGLFNERASCIWFRWLYERGLIFKKVFSDDLKRRTDLCLYLFYVSTNINVC